ncbi:cuticle protein 19-like [Palaemon carinicauda]|uniref:cuticle protein 19-like n=1 Tax=Palaemon carinicauda TaxID=392227 RepID=UPI0035B5ACFB
MRMSGLAPMVSVSSLLMMMMMMAAINVEAKPVLGPYDYPPMPYDFRYGIRDQYTGNDFGHEETSNGDAVTGRYYVLLPDGRRQVVSYVADHHRGYVATITYENVGVHPNTPVNGYQHG